MIEYSDVLAGVAGYLEMDESDTELLDKFDILNKANDAQDDLITRVPISVVSTLIKSVTGNLSQDVSCYQWPSDYVRFSDLYIDYSAEITQTNQGVEAVPTPENTFQVRSLDQRPQTEYPVYAFVAGGFEVQPAPSADQDNGFMLRYVYKIPDMVSGSQNSLLPANLKSLLIYGTVARCAAVDNYDIPMSERFQKLFDDGIKALWGTNNDFKKGA